MVASFVVKVLNTSIACTLTLKVVKFGNTDSVEKLTSTYVAKLQNVYTQQSPAEMTTSSSKTPIIWIPFYTNYDYKGNFAIDKDFMHGSYITHYTWAKMLLYFTFAFVNSIGYPYGFNVGGSLLTVIIPNT